MAQRSDIPADRQIFSTGNNEYATGLNDENEWQENIVDYDIPMDDEIADYFEDPDEAARPLYNETGYDKNRIE